MKKRLGFHIILLGQIAAGKETQARILMDKYALHPVESGIFSRNLLKAKTPDGEWARRTTGKGLPLPVELIKKWLVSQVENKPKNKDLIFIGNPRLKPEAQLLKKILGDQHEDFFGFYINLPDKEIYRRSRSRREGKEKAIYKVLDGEEIIARRIKYHKEQVSKSVAYFEKLGKMKKINGNKTIKEVAEAIDKNIKTYQKKLTAKK